MGQGGRRMKKGILGMNQQTLEKIERYFEEEYEIQINQFSSYASIVEVVREKIWGSWLEKEDYDCFGELLAYVSAAENYDIDLSCEFYMYMKWYEAKWKEIEKGMYNVIDRIKTGDMDKGLCSKQIIEYFPFEIREENEKTDDGNEKLILRMKEFGWDFLTIMMCEDQNIEMFNVDKKGKDISRYGYGKGKKLYEKLINTPTENLYLYEKNFGYLLTGVIYPMIKNVNTIDDLEKVKKIIEYLCMMPCNIRKEVAEKIFEKLEINYLDQTKGKKRKFFCNVEKIEAFIKEVQPLIKKYYEDLCYLEYWDVINECGKREEAIFEYLKYYEENVNKCHKEYTMGYEIEQDYYNRFGLLKEYKMLEWSNETQFLFKLLNGEGGMALDFLMKYHDIKDPGERVDRIKEEIRDYVKENEKSEIIKCSDKLNLTNPKVV